MNVISKAIFHLPGLFEFYEFYKVFLPVFFEHRNFFYPWVEIGSIYGAPTGALWSGGRLEDGCVSAEDVLVLLKKYGISGRLAFSNSLLAKEHLADKQCNELCQKFEKFGLAENGSQSDLCCAVCNGVIVHSDLLLEYIKERYPGLYLVSSTTKVLTNYNDFLKELGRKEFDFIVPDFRLNKRLNELSLLNDQEKQKVEFLVNECCYVGCGNRKACYENVSRRILEMDCAEYVCTSPGGHEGYKFSKAMKNPSFISLDDIKNVYLPKGFENFKIEGRSLGTAMILEFLLYYMVKPECQLEVREMIYLDCMLDLF